MRGAARARRLEGLRGRAGRRRGAGGTTELLLDVTDGERSRARPAVGGRLDGLVDNAGIALAAPLEYLPLDELRRQLEVNVVGQLAVTQALPARDPGGARPDRARRVDRRDERAALPRAVRDLEVRPRGDGRRAARRARARRDPRLDRPSRHDRDADLDEAAADRGRAAAGGDRAVREAARGDARFAAAARAKKAAPVDSVAKAIEHALTDEHPKTRYLVGRDAHLRAAVERLPDRMRDRVVRGRCSAASCAVQLSRCAA